MTKEEKIQQYVLNILASAADPELAQIAEKAYADGYKEGQLDPILSELEWEEKLEDWEIRLGIEDPTIVAETQFGDYEILLNSNGKYDLWYMSKYITTKDTIEEAKQVAQEDFSGRFKSFLKN